MCLLLYACASTIENPIDNDEFNSLMKAAENAIDDAADVDGEWRDSRLILNNAKEAAIKGNLSLAMQLAQQAKEQGEMAEQQAKEQDSPSGPWLF